MHATPFVGGSPLRATLRLELKLRFNFKRVLIKMFREICSLLRVIKIVPVLSCNASNISGDCSSPFEGPTQSPLLWVLGFVSLGYTRDNPKKIPQAPGDRLRNLSV